MYFMIAASVPFTVKHLVITPVVNEAHAIVVVERQGIAPDMFSVQPSRCILAYAIYLTCPLAR